MVDVLSNDLLDVATPAEKDLYASLLERQAHLLSPLDFAVYVTPITKRYHHVEVLNEYILALVELRLYKAGPGPPSVWFGRVEKPGGDSYIIDIPDRHDIVDLIASTDQRGEELVEIWGEHPNTGSRVIRRLAISMPPRHGKSHLVSEHLPSWLVSKYPDAKVAVATYSDDFAWRWGRKNRLLLNRTEFCQPTGGATGARGYITFDDRPAEMQFVGVGGGLTGSGFTVGIIDDPFKNAEEAMSESIRQSRKDWYTTTFVTRKETHSAVEIMMFTRWHEDDIFGEFVLDEDGDVRDDWVTLSLPALAIEDDLLGREPGRALCPAMHTERMLRDLQDSEPVWFEALYQGNPNIEAGGIFSRPFHYYRSIVDDDGGSVYVFSTVDGEELRVRPEHCVRYATVDTAATVKTSSDWTVFMVWDWSRVHQRLFLVGLRRERVLATRLFDTVSSWCSSWPSLRWLSIESRTYGLQLVQDFLRFGTITVRPLDTDSDKVARAIPAGQAAFQGKILLPAKADWIPALEAELLIFENGKHDDQVDAFAYGWQEAVKMPRVRGKSGPKLRSGPDAQHRARIKAMLDKGKNRKSRPRLSEMLRS